MNTTTRRGRYRKPRNAAKIIPGPGMIYRHPLAIAAAFVTGVVLLIGACAADTTAEVEPEPAPVVTESEPETEPVVDEPADEPEPEPEPEPEEPELTVAQEQAIGSAEDYLDYTAFSRSGLIEQLEYEGFSTDDATWAVDNVTVDWNEQAAASAQAYLDYSSFSRSGLIEQLEYEGFTPEQAEYGVNETGL